MGGRVVCCASEVTTAVCRRDLYSIYLMFDAQCPCIGCDRDAPINVRKVRVPRFQVPAWTFRRFSKLLSGNWFLENDGWEVDDVLWARQALI